MAAPPVAEATAAGAGAEPLTASESQSTPREFAALFVGLGRFGLTMSTKSASPPSAGAFSQWSFSVLSRHDVPFC